jgi:hypothetical protein
LSVRPVEKPSGAGLERLAQQRAHGGDVVGRGRLVRQRALAHHRHAQRVVRHQRQEVQVCGMASSAAM